jgi:hypothetical protein
MTTAARGALGYTDRFGHEWRVETRRATGAAWRVAFTCGAIRLAVAEPVDTDPATLSPAGLKDLFCDAERELEYGGEIWFVGYRSRPAGRTGQSGAGLCTRFRSASGEVRYHASILHFRHLSAEVLREDLARLSRAGPKKPGV